MIFHEKNIHKILLDLFRKKLCLVEICKAFQDRLSFLNRRMIVYISWNLLTKNIEMPAI